MNVPPHLKPRRQKVSGFAYAAPFMGFMLLGWYGLANVVQTKREIKGATQGLESVEELDPLDQMRAQYGLNPRPKAKPPPPPISTLEEELEEIQKTLDIENFDYKPVPRLPDEDE